MIARRKVKQVIEVLDLVTQNKLDRLRDDLVWIHDRIADLEGRLIQLQDSKTSYRYQELASEHSTWMAHHRVIDMQIREIVGGNPDYERAQAERERTEKMRQQIVNRHRRQSLETAESFEAIGDWRQASVARLDSLRARAIAEHEIH
jgi:hypothetical protein